MNVMQTFVRDLQECETQPWVVGYDGYIRTRRREGHSPLCPIEAVWFIRTGQEEFGAYTIGTDLHIPVTVKLDVIQAADNLRHNDAVTAWRGVLLKLLDIPPEQERVTSASYPTGG